MSDDTFSTQLHDESRRLTENIGELLRATLAEVPIKPAFPHDPDAVTRTLDVPLPERGPGGDEVLARLRELNDRAGANVGGPRCFHFVIGGSTPAAMGADLLATACETLTYTWVVSPLGVHLEQRALAWLRELFGLPAAWSGVMVTGGTMANFIGLASGRQWWGEEQGVDVTEAGMSGLPPLEVHTSGYVHAATLKCLGMLGVGMGQVTKHARDGRGRVDLEAFEAGLERLDGAPALVVVNAGEVNAGDFDPVPEMIRIAREHHTWIHVDGAFGLFARVSPRTAHLVEGVERADSVSVDGHKWLNVPYDQGYGFVRDHGLMARTFRYSADYLPDPDPARPTPGSIAPESSRRGRSFAAWATLAAYGREGYRELVEHCLDLAQHLAARAREEDELELMAEVPLNIVAFRYIWKGATPEAADELNHALAERIIADGAFMVGSTKLAGRTILRPAFSNWRTTREDVDAFADCVIETGQRLVAGL